jgi:hypothetical protein
LFLTTFSKATDDVQFGMAVLRGMGWRPDEGIGGFNKKVKINTYF